jgi:ribosome biogenesis GTPase
LGELADRFVELSWRRCHFESAMRLPLAQLLRIEAPALAGRALRAAAPRPWPWRGLAAAAPPPRRARIAAAASAGDEPAAAAPDDASASPPPPPSAAFGLVTSAQANFVRVRVDALDPPAPGGGPPPRPALLCVVRALLKKMRQPVLVGDRVRVVGVDWADGRGMVEAVLPRASALAEPPVANVGRVLLVFAAARPPLSPSSATRFLVAAEAAGLPVLVALNKCDLLAPDEAAAAAARLAAWGYRAIPVSVSAGTGLDELEAALGGNDGGVTVVAGPSGVGKSSLINALRLRAAGAGGGAAAAVDAMAGARPSGPDAVEAEAEGGSAEERAAEAAREAARAAAAAGVEMQPVGVISERSARGKHTTRHVSLVELAGGGLLADTPGFNQPEAEALGLAAADLGRCFPEVGAALALAAAAAEDGAKRGCAFSDCQHLHEPGCAVRSTGWERYPFYADLHAELRAAEATASARAASKARREGATKGKSRAGGGAGAEARLAAKSHRRVSRRAARQGLADAAIGGEDEGEGEDEREEDAALPL